MRIKLAFNRKNEVRPPYVSQFKNNNTMIYDIITILNNNKLLSDKKYYYILDSLPYCLTKPLFTKI